MAKHMFFGMRDRKFELEKGDVGFPAELSDAGIDRIMGYGDASLVAEGGIAIVGCTERYPYGMSMARYFTDRLAIDGITPVIPAATGAASAALTQIREANADPDMPDVRAIVVMGGGADMPYPPTGDIEETLRSVVSGGGAVVSAAGWGTLPDAELLMARDAVTRAIARAAIVVASDYPDLPFGFAEAMMASGKPVGSVPGKIGHPGSTGTNELLKRGAVPMVDAACVDMLAGMAE